MSENKQVDPLEDTRAESIRPGKMIAGAPIGGYNLIDVLGEGGMGVVWSAHDPMLDRTIAIKVLKSRDASPSLKLRLLREGRAMARLKHPNVLTVHEVGTDGDRDFIAMELVDGGPLDHWLAKHPTRVEVMAALLDAGRGLAAAHAVGLVHRDFKPNNVLRSKDGRVMVTDFGLARGMGDDWGAALTASGNSLDPVDQARMGVPQDSVLDSPLTKTGALIGTPAYMSPEQFTGSEPDPRTDQFAFCVTAWQMLTGARPYHGRTLDELRQAASAGVNAVVTDLPKPLRAVLARGLDPDPAKRWPDLETLLRELETAAKPKRRWPLYAAGAGVLAIVVISALLVWPSSKVEAPICGAADTAYADAWSPTRLRLAESGRPLSAAFEAHRRRWLTAYDQTCKAEPKPARGALETRLGCLHAIRERAAAFVDLLARATPDIQLGFDPYVGLPAPEVCATKAFPIPVIPDDARRDKVLDTFAKEIAGATPDPATVRAAGWPPLIPMIDQARGIGLLKRGDYAHARTELERAIAASETTDPRTTALARIALLEVSITELAHPDDHAGTKRETMHEEITRLLTYARSAVKAAGDEPLLVGLLAMREAQVTADLAERAPKRESYDHALGRATDARKQFELIGDARRSARAAALQADIDLRRGDASALADVEFAARSAAETLEREGQPPVPALESTLARIAFTRSDYDAAHQRLERVAKPTKPDGPTHEGVVLDTDGKPAMNATVVAWTGELHGDPRWLVSDPQTLHGEIVETGAEGRFTIHAPAGAAIIAQRGDLRSIPIALPSGPITIKLAATTEVIGKLEARSVAGIDGFARFAIGAHSWYLEAAVAREGFTFRIARLPGGRPLFGAIGRSGDATRRILNASPTKLSWPTGRMFDVVIKGALEPGATVYLFRELNQPEHTRAELAAIAATSTDVSQSPAVPIGSRITEAGRALYVPDAHHAVFISDQSFGAACVAAGAARDAKVTCANFKDADAVVIEL